jgi:predicted nucleic acid-binding protein
VPAVVLDACVLYPAALRDFLLLLVEAEVFEGHMTATILDECFRSIERRRPDLSPDKLRKTRDAIEDAFGDVLIFDYEALLDGLALPDPDDRHVLAAAIQGGVPVILTFNLRDFPATVLAAHGVVAMHPDTFLVACVAESPESVIAVVQKQADGLRNPPTTVSQMLERLVDQGLVNTVAAIRRHLP